MWLLKENRETYALIKKLFVASERGHSITELPASRERIEDGEILRSWKNTAHICRIPDMNQANFTKASV